MGQRAVIYCRVSTADQSCVRQKDELKRFAERAGYEVSGIFIETGSGVRVDRAERRKVMALVAEKRSIDGSPAIWESARTLLLPLCRGKGEFIDR